MALSNGGCKVEDLWPIDRDVTIQGGPDSINSYKRQRPRLSRSYSTPKSSLSSFSTGFIHQGMSNSTKGVGLGDSGMIDKN